MVADSQQGQGIGTLLASALIADLTARGIDRVEVFASATNEAVPGWSPGRRRTRYGNATVRP